MQRMQQWAPEGLDYDGSVFICVHLWLSTEPDTLSEFVYERNTNAKCKINA